MKKLILLSALLLFSFNGWAEEVPLYETITDNVPKIGITTEAYLGDRMLEQRTGDYRECIVPKRTFETTVFNTKNFLWSVKANQPICKKYADSKIYYSSYQMVEGVSVPIPVSPVMFIENDKTYELHIGAIVQSRTTFPDYLRFKNINKNDIEINGRYFLYQPNSFQQTIEYAGKSGNQLKFIYSEFNHGLARDAFTREFQVDLNEGNVLAFKGALIEIESATNINIRYKVIRNFRD